MFDPRQMYTLDEYWLLVETFPEKKYEFIDGTVRMMTGESPAYAQLAARIGSILNAALRETDCNIYGSGALQLTEKRVYFPDVSVSCDPADWTRKKALEAPSVVVEVTSPSTEKTDKIEKLAAYQSYPTIQEILLVDSRRRHVEQYHRVGMHKWEVSLCEREDDVIDLVSIEVSFTLREVYAKVYLELEEE